MHRIGHRFQVRHDLCVKPDLISERSAGFLHRQIGHSAHPYAALCQRNGHCRAVPLGCCACDGALPAGGKAKLTACATEMGLVPKEGDEAEMTEARRAVFRKAPDEPSKDEIEAHMKTHVPFRSWCAICVKGRGRRGAHLQGAVEDGGRDHTVLAIDCGFLKDGEIEDMEGDDEEDT